MPGFNTIPGSSGGGGAGALTFVASVYMSTYNRSWARPGTAGNYGIYSQNQESGYAYFVGTGTTTGVPLNRMQAITHDFIRIDIIAPSNDLISLYKVKVKDTTVFNNPFTAYNGGIPSFSAPITSSGNFVLPNNALPLVNVLVNGGGGGNAGNHCDAGGAGGGVVKLTAYQAVGTTGVVIGGGRNAGSSNGSHGGSSYFGNVYALGGGDGGGHSHNATVNSGQFANGGGAGGHNSYTVPGTGHTQLSTTGLGNTGSPVFHGGFAGGASSGSDSQQSGGGGGAGSAAAGTAGNNSAPGSGGIGHTSDIITTGVQTMFGGGGRGGRANGSTGGQSFGTGYNSGYGYGAGGAGYSGSGAYNGASGIVVVRYYIP